MKSLFMVTVFGADKDGIINAISTKSHQLGGNWLANKIVHLDGQMTGMFKLEIDADKVEAFKAAMAEFGSLEFRYLEVENKPETPRETTAVTIEGDDRTGLIADITHLLGDMDVKISHFESQRYPVVGLGISVFEAHLDLQLPEALPPVSLKAELEQLDSNLRVFVEA